MPLVRKAALRISVPHVPCTIINMMFFVDRRDAGRQLAAQLALRTYRAPVVIALPRGGVPVGFEVAVALGFPLDILIVRKIGAPGNREYAMGALAEDGTVWLNPEALEHTTVEQRYLDETIETERRHIERLKAIFRRFTRLSVRHRDAILIDDGLATGSTARAAVASLRKQGARRVILAVPVCSPETAARLRSEVDEIIYLEAPEEFFAVGTWYDDFSQVSDNDVARFLEDSRKAHPRSILEVSIEDEELQLPGRLEIPLHPLGTVIFAHGSGSSRNSPRNQHVAEVLNTAGLATLLFDLLTPLESMDRNNVFDIPLLSNRLTLATHWIRRHGTLGSLPIGYFGASTGAAAALEAAAEHDHEVFAVVSRGGRPDLAGTALQAVDAPTLLIVGGNDPVVLELNRQALAALPNADLVIIPGATHLFEESGALDKVSTHAAKWFVDHFRRSRRHEVA